MERICNLASFLYLLRDTDGFDTIIERIMDRDSRAPFYEMKAAYMYRKLGCNIYVNRETGVKGEDFDFVAENETGRMNVEVTELQIDSVSEDSINNMLGRKRKQLPAEGPGALYCKLPLGWIDNEHDFRLVGDVTKHYLANRTRRINYVNYIWPIMRVIDDIVFFSDVISTVENPNASAATTIGPPKYSEPLKLELSDPKDTKSVYPIHFEFIELLNKVPPPSNG
jgi:hypothetical protein